MQKFKSNVWSVQTEIITLSKKINKCYHNNMHSWNYNYKTMDTQEGKLLIE